MAYGQKIVTQMVRRLLIFVVLQVWSFDVEGHILSQSDYGARMNKKTSFDKSISDAIRCEDYSIHKDRTLSTH